MWALTPWIRSRMDRLDGRWRYIEAIEALDIVLYDECQFARLKYKFFVICLCNAFILGVDTRLNRFSRLV